MSRAPAIIIGMELHFVIELNTRFDLKKISIGEQHKHKST